MTVTDTSKYVDIFYRTHHDPSLSAHIRTVIGASPDRRTVDFPTCYSSVDIEVLHKNYAGSYDIKTAFLNPILMWVSNTAFDSQ